MGGAKGLELESGIGDFWVTNIQMLFSHGGAFVVRVFPLMTFDLRPQEWVISYLMVGSHPRASVFCGILIGSFC